VSTGSPDVLRVSGDDPNGGQHGDVAAFLGGYGSGRAAASGFGEAALDRALADPSFVTARLHHLRTVGPERTLLWAAAAIDWAAPEVCWTVTDATASSRALESQVRAGLSALDVELWGKR
jgi:hypothetical protein